MKKLKFSGLSKSKKLSILLASVFLIATATGIWYFVGYSATTTASVISANSDPMIIIQDLEDFGILDLSVSGSALSYTQEFIIEPPIPLKEMRYTFYTDINATEINPECNVSEDEINITFWRTTGSRGFLGQIFDGDVLLMLDNIEPNTFEVRMDIISRAVCSQDFEISVKLIPVL